MKNVFWYSIAAAMFSASSLLAADNLLEQAKEVKAHPYNDKINLITDNNIETKWVSYTGENAKGTITVNFGEETEFNAIAIWGANLVEADVESSTDGKTWTPLAKISGSAEANFIGKHFADGAQAAMLRFTFKGGPKSAAISVQEMKIYNIDGPAHKALFRPITETGDSMNWRTPPTFYVDGNSKTRANHWSSYKGSTITIDLGEETEIKQLVLLSNNGFSSVNVSTSNDGKTFAEAGTIAVPGKEQKLDLTQVKARYVKLAVSGNAGLNEIRIF